MQVCMRAGWKKIQKGCGSVFSPFPFLPTPSHLSRPSQVHTLAPELTVHWLHCVTPLLWPAASRLLTDSLVKTTAPDTASKALPSALGLTALLGVPTLSLSWGHTAGQWPVMPCHASLPPHRGGCLPTWRACILLDAAQQRPARHSGPLADFAVTRDCNALLTALYPTSSPCCLHLRSPKSRSPSGPPWLAHSEQCFFCVGERGRVNGWRGSWARVTQLTSSNLETQSSFSASKPSLASQRAVVYFL